MSRIDEIRERLTEDQSARPTREEADYLLSQLKDGGADAICGRAHRRSQHRTAHGTGCNECLCSAFTPATAPTETSVRCGECGHDTARPRQSNGWCAAVVRDAGGSLVYCGCKCDKIILTASVTRAKDEAPTGFIWPKPTLAGYDYALEMAHLNGFDNITEAIIAAVAARAQSTSIFPASTEQAGERRHAEREWLPYIHETCPREVPVWLAFPSGNVSLHTLSTRPFFWYEDDPTHYMVATVPAAPATASESAAPDTPVAQPEADPVVQDAETIEQLDGSVATFCPPRQPSATTSTSAAVEAAKEIVPDCLSRTCFIKDCSYGECWGCDAAKAERERVTAIISRYTARQPEVIDGSMTEAQLQRAALTAASRSIDLETAQELVYLRDHHERLSRPDFDDVIYERDQLRLQLFAANEALKLTEKELTTARADAIGEAIEAVKRRHPQVLGEIPEPDATAWVAARSYLETAHGSLLAALEQLKGEGK